MEKTNEYQNGVIGVLNLARKVNQEIGAYEEHFINQNFIFTVKLSNGAVTMSKEVAQDFEASPNNITQERINRVVKTFRIR